MRPLIKWTLKISPLLGKVFELIAKAAEAAGSMDPWDTAALGFFILVAILPMPMAWLKRRKTGK